MKDRNKEIEKINKEFYDILIADKDSIRHIYYDENECIAIHIISEEIYNFFNKDKEERYSPSYIEAGESFDGKIDLIITLKKETYCNEISLKYLKDILKKLKVESMNLDVNYGKELLDRKCKALEGYYNTISDEILLNLIDMKTNEINYLTLSQLFSLAGGLKCVYSTGNAYILEYKNTSKKIYLSQVKFKYKNLNSKIKSKYEMYFIFENYMKLSRAFYSKMYKDNIDFKVTSSSDDTIFEKITLTPMKTFEPSIKQIIINNEIEIINRKGIYIKN